MILDCIIKVPEALEVDQDDWIAENLDVAWEISTLGCEWSGFMMPSTHVEAGYKLILVSIHIDSETPALLLESLFDLYAMDWELLGMNSFNAIVDVLDAEGEVIDKVVKVYKELDPAILTYLDDRYTYDVDGNVTGTRVKEFNWIPMWAGQADRV